MMAIVIQDGKDADRTVREVAEASGQDAFKVIGAMAQVRK